MPIDPLKTRPTAESVLALQPSLFKGASGEWRYDATLHPSVLRDIQNSSDLLVRPLGHGVLAVQSAEGFPVIVQPLFKEPVVDFSALASVTPNARPIIFFKPEDNKGVKLGAADHWLSSVQSLGYILDRSSDPYELRSSLTHHQPDIVCFSVNNGTWDSIRAAYVETKRLSPSAVTILGGMGAVPEAARFFDVVVMGEGDVTLPALLRILQQRNESGPLSEKAIADLFGYSLNRYAGGANGVPLQEVAVDWSRNVFLRCGENVVPPPVNGMSGKLSRPIPINATELDILSGQRLATRGQFSDGAIYAQRGCRGEKRCSFCSISADPGRKMSADNVIALMVDARERGVYEFSFSDDDFLQDARSANTLLDRIESEGLHRQMSISAQFRADTKHLDVVQRLLTLGIRIQVGVETLDPLRAEKMGKVPQGGGKKYIADVTRLFDCIGEFYSWHPTVPQQVISVYMINLSPGDDVVPAAREMRLELEMMQRLYARYGYVPLFLNGAEQMPVLGDRVVEGMSGRPHAQLLRRPITETSEIMHHKGIQYRWHIFAHEQSEGVDYTTGISEPQLFEAGKGVALYSNFRVAHSTRSVVPRGHLKLYYDVAAIFESILGQNHEPGERLSVKRAAALRAEVVKIRQLLKGGELIESSIKSLSGQLQTNHQAMQERAVQLLDYAQRWVESGKSAIELAQRNKVIAEIKAVRVQFQALLDCDYDFYKSYWSRKFVPILTQVFGSVGEANRQYDYHVATQRNKQFGNMAKMGDIVSSSLVGAGTFLFAKQIVDVMLDEPQTSLESIVYGYDVLGLAVLTDTLMDVGVRKYIWKEFASQLPAVEFGARRFFAGLGMSQLVYKSLNTLVEQTGVPHGVTTEVTSLVGTGLICGGVREVAHKFLTSETAAMAGGVASGVGLIYLGIDTLFGVADAVADLAGDNYSAWAKEEWYRAVVVYRGSHGLFGSAPNVPWYERVSSSVLNATDVIVPKSYLKLTASLFDENNEWLKKCELNLRRGASNCASFLSPPSQ